MKAGIFFTGSGPILALTTYYPLDDPALAGKLASRGIDRYIAYEVPIALVRERYGPKFGMVMGDLHQGDDLRVLDYNGHHVFHVFELDDLGAPVFHQKKQKSGGPLVLNGA